MLHNALDQDNSGLCIPLIKIGAVDLNAKDPNNRDRTALHKAVVFQMNEVVKVLIEQECDLNARDIHQRTPLMLSAMRGEDLPTLELLIKEGADFD